MNAPTNPSQDEAPAQVLREPQPVKGRQGCPRCGVIRLFVLAAISIAILQLVAPNTFAILQGVSSLSLAIVFVGGLAIIAIVKSLAEYLASQADDTDMQE